MNLNKRQKNILCERESWQYIWPGCDENMARAIEQCWSQFSLGDSTRGDFCSISKKVKKLFDGVLNEWIVANQDLSLPYPLNFSEVISLSRADADKIIEHCGRMAAFQISLYADPINNKAHMVSATLSSLRFFSHFCHAYY